MIQKPVSESGRIPLHEVLANRPRDFVVSARPPAWVNAKEPWVHKNSLFAVGRANGRGRLTENSAKLQARAAISERMESFVTRLERIYQENGAEPEVSQRAESFTAGYMRDVAIRLVWHDGKDQWAALAELKDPQKNFTSETQNSRLHERIRRDPVRLRALFETITVVQPVVVLEVQR